MRLKYSLIKYHYTEYSNIAKEGGVYFKPMNFEEDFQFGLGSNAIYDFMLGKALKASVLTDNLNVNTTYFYFPGNVTWCNLFNSQEKCFKLDDDSLVELPSKAYDSYLHLRSGYIVPWIDAV